MPGSWRQRSLSLGQNSPVFRPLDKAFKFSKLQLYMGCLWGWKELSVCMEANIPRMVRRQKQFPKREKERFAYNHPKVLGPLVPETQG